MAPARILIAEDDRSIRTLLRTYLITEGYEVSEAATGEEVMDAITQVPPPDIIVLDLSMPAPQGMEVLKRLHHMVVRPRPRVIVLTANGSVDRAVEAVKLGAVDFLEKPCEPVRFLAAIARTLDQKILAEAATPEGYAAVINRARRYLADGNSAKVETCLNAAQHFGGQDPEYFFLLGLWHELNDRPIDARNAYLQASQFEIHHHATQEALRRLSANSAPS